MTAIAVLIAAVIIAASLFVVGDALSRQVGALLREVIAIRSALHDDWDEISHPRRLSQNFAAFFSDLRGFRFDPIRYLGAEEAAERAEFQEELEMDRSIDRTLNKKRD